MDGDAEELIAGDVPSPGDARGEDAVGEHASGAPRRPVARPRPVFGALRGEGPIADTFFDPLPEDELRAWEGEADPPADASGCLRAELSSDRTVHDGGGNVSADMGLSDAETR